MIKYENPPERIRSLPEEAQRIYVKSFNEEYDRSKDQTKANTYAWEQVRKNFVLTSEGKWVKVTLEQNTTLRKVSRKPNRIGEDDFFVYYDTVVTGVGVHNGFFKPPEEMYSIPRNVPKHLVNAIPGTVDHPPGPEVELKDDKYQVGFFSNLEVCRQDPKNPRIKAIDAVPKSRPDVIKAIENGQMKGLSIGFRRFVEPENGEWNGFYYNGVERSIRIYHIARMFNQPPACPPPTCGYNADGLANLTDDEVLSMWNRLVDDYTGEPQTTDASQRPVLLTDPDVQEALVEVQKNREGEALADEERKLRVAIMKKLLEEDDDD